jgi:hypothetical protein
VGRVGSSCKMIANDVLAENFAIEEEDDENS